MHISNISLIRNYTFYSAAGQPPPGGPPWSTTPVGNLPPSQPTPGDHHQRIPTPIGYPPPVKYLQLATPRTTTPLANHRPDNYPRRTTPGELPPGNHPLRHPFPADNHPLDSYTSPSPTTTLFEKTPYYYNHPRKLPHPG